MPTTPNRSYPYPSGTDAATVPAHLQSALIQVDADVQAALDEVASKVSLLQDGTAPAALLTQIRTESSNIAGTTVAAAVDGLASQTYVDTAITDDTPSVIGVVVQVGPGTPAATTVAGVPVLWMDTRDSSAWVAAAPTIDNVTKAVTIPSDEGATYLLNGIARDAGTYPIDTSGGSVEVTVRAEPREGYTLADPVVWTGVITAGWALLGTDALTSGAWETGRTAPSGTWTITNPENGAISSAGLTVTTHVATTAAKAVMPTGKTAIRFSIGYDLTTRVAPGSAPSFALALSIASPTYPNNPAGPAVVLRALTSSISGGLYTAAVPANINLGAEAWPTPMSATGPTIPASGTVIIEVVGTDVTMLVGTTTVATGVLAGPFDSRHYSLTVTGGIATVRDLQVQTA